MMPKSDEAVFGHHHAQETKRMSLAGLIPTDVSLNAAIAICAIAFVSGTARGFSGFGSALIFMPLASSMAAPRLVAALLLIIDFVAAAPLVPNAWKQADRKATAVMVFGALIGVPIGTYFLSRLDPVTTRWIISGFVSALLLLLLSGWRYRGKDHPAISVGIGGLSGFCSGLAQTGGPPIVGYWLGRPIASGDRARQHPAVLRRLGFLFRRELFPDRADHMPMRSGSRCWSVRSTRIGVWFGASAVRPRQRDAVPHHLLRLDRGGGHHRPAGAGRGADGDVPSSSSPRTQGPIPRCRLFIQRGSIFDIRACGMGPARARLAGRRLERSSITRSQYA